MFLDKLLIFYKEKIIRKTLLLISIIFFLSVFIRLINISSPFFTADEARIAYRGYVLSVSGKDELGRNYPLIFNSSYDYQLPVTSYITALGILILGKNDFGSRTPFIVLGSLITVICFLISQKINPKKEFWFITAFIISLSPALIFLSKTPNDGIVITLIFTCIFYLLISSYNKIIVFFFVSLLAVAALLTSKITWFVLAPFVVVTAFFFSDQFSKRYKILLVSSIIILSLFTFTAFLKVPQSTRSLKENNITLFSDITTSNGINRLRGQGLQSGWPSLIEKLLFNKLLYINVGVSGWLSYFSPSIYFSRFNPVLFNEGIFSKILIVPMILGAIFVLKRRSKLIWLFSFLPVLTFPAILTYPNFTPELILLSIPFLALIVAFGFFQLNKFFVGLIIFFVILELGLSLSFILPGIKGQSNKRPGWIKEIVQDAAVQSNVKKISFSDDIGEEVISFYQWYNFVDPKLGFTQDIDFPYRYHQRNLQNIKLLEVSDQFSVCGIKDELLFLSQRDFTRVNISKPIVYRKFQDSLGEDRVYELEGKCGI